MSGKHIKLHVFRVHGNERQVRTRARACLALHPGWPAALAGQMPRQGADLQGMEAWCHAQCALSLRPSHTLKPDILATDICTHSGK